MDVNMSPSSAMEATKYSKYVSLMGIKALELSLKDVKNEEANQKNCTGCKCKKQDLKEEIIEGLCYACTHIIQNLVRFNLLVIIKLSILRLNRGLLDHLSAFAIITSFHHSLFLVISFGFTACI